MNTSILNKSILLIKSHYETLLYLLAIMFMALALFMPTIQLKQQVHNYLLVADVSQSMNAEDESDAYPKKISTRSP